MRILLILVGSVAAFSVKGLRRKGSSAGILVVPNSALALSQRDQDGPASQAGPALPVPTLVALDTVPDPPVPNLTSAYVTLAVLLFGFASNQWSRQALYYLCDFSSSGVAERHINVALNFNKEMYAALASFGFTIVFAVVSLFSGGVSDKTDRNKVAGLSCLVWSLATGLQAGARNFADLVPLRVAVGASQAFYNPAAYTLLSDLFPKKMLGTVNGIFSSGVYLGGALASLSILLDNMIGWRYTLLVTAAVGFVVSALLTLAIPEPRRSSEKVSNSPQLPDIGDSNMKTIAAAPTVLAELRSVLGPLEAKLLLSATVLRFCAGFSIAIWKAPFVFSKFPGSENAFAGSNAAIVAVGGLLSSLVGGYISDQISEGGGGRGGVGGSKGRARAWVPAVGSLLAAPAWAMFVLADNPQLAAGVLLAEYLVAECWFGPTLAALFQAVPASSRGAAQGLFSVLAAVGNLAPVVVGALAGGALGNFALGDVLLYGVSGCYFVSGVLFALAAVEAERVAATQT